MSKSQNSLQQKLMHALLEIQKIDSNGLGFRCSATSDITLWKIEYFTFRKGSKLEKDIVKYKEKTGRDYLEFNLTFSQKYPSVPPSLRLVQPALNTEIGGAFCVNGSTSSIWKANIDIDVGLVNMFNFIFNDSDPEINFARVTPYTPEEAEARLKVIYDCHKDWGEASTECK
jgi:ubiquitin-protein ligase